MQAMGKTYRIGIQIIDNSSTCDDNCHAGNGVDDGLVL